MKRVGVYIDYSNVYSGARDAFMLDYEDPRRGNVNPDYLAKRVALQAPDASASPRRETHILQHAKVFRGAPDPHRQPKPATYEARRAYQWERWGCQVLRHTLDYGSGKPVEKGIDVRLATSLLMDAVSDAIDVAVIVSADKDFRYALLQVRDLQKVEIEVAVWKAIPGGKALGRIELRPERPWESEVPCHLLDRKTFGKVEDKIDYKGQPDPPGWLGQRH